MKSRLLQSPVFYRCLFVAVLLPALLLNLGVHHIFIHTDESLRALIALEMILRDEFIVPTVNGELYFNKPPLYNWFIAGSFYLFGDFSRFALRFPVVLAIFLYGFFIIRYISREAGLKMGWWVAVATITSGRILFYDSFLGLIDIAFSTLIFCNFMLFYFLGKSKRYFTLFAATYFLSALAYLMKGLPPIVFQAFTLSAFAIFQKNWKILFSPQHFAGILFFILPVGGYYLAYLDENPQSLATLAKTLWIESSKRTVTDHGVLETVKSIFTFPLENLYHFAPWTLLILALFSKARLRALWNNEFIRFCILVFAFNILVYWTSPGVHPRYLFMFLPLFFLVLFSGFEMSGERLQRIIYSIFLGVMVLGVIAPWFAISRISELGLNSYVPKLIFISASMLVLTILYQRRSQFRWLILGTYLLVIRIGFDWFVLPFRDAEGRNYEMMAERAVELTRDEKLFILEPNFVHSATSFIIEKERKEVLEIRNMAEVGNFYIMVKEEFDADRFDSLLVFGTRGTDRQLVLARCLSSKSH